MFKIRLSVFIILLLMLLWPTWAASEPQGPRPGSVRLAPLPIPYAHRGRFNSLTSIAASVQQITPNKLVSNSSLAGLSAQVDGDRWHADVTTLAQFGAGTAGGWGTRRSLTSGNLAARDWISATLASLGWTPSFQAFDVEGDESYNVIGESTGATTPANIYIVGAHMDSISPEAWTLAPGAEDNASGVAALLEIARILQDYVPASTIRLIAFSGEEQGWIGSEAYASYLQTISGELDNIKGVYILDMVGYTSDPDSLDVLLESQDPNTNPWMGDLRDHLASMAATYANLDIFISNTPFGSDHIPFLDRQVPAVLLIGNEWDSYPAYHSTDDIPSNVDPAEGREIIRMLVTALADKAGPICLFADLDCDGDVDVADLEELAAHWKSILGEPGYEARYDFNRDGVINTVDMMRAVAVFRE